MEYSTRHSSSLQGLARLAGALVVGSRPKQWTKNLLIFLALFFTIGEAWSPNEVRDAWPLFAKATLAVVLFSAVSSAVYLINDIFDADKDRLHPSKRSRPVASGQLSVTVARNVAIFLMAAGLTAAFVLEPRFGFTTLIYVAVMMAYTSFLKRVILLDVFAITLGFVLRAAAGAAVIDVPISPWLYTCTGLGALFIALAKRRSELAAAGESAPAQRDTLGWYTRSFLDQLIVIATTSVLLTYSFYTFTAPNLPENHAMMLTIPFVAYGLARYLYLVHTQDLGETPEDLILTDLPLISSIVLWLAAAASILVIYRV